MQIPPLPGNRRHLLQFTVTGVQEDLTEMGPSASKNPCGNGQNSAQCQSASSTVLIIVLGMSTMMIVVLITIVLLCRSHYTHRQMVERRQQQRLREEGNRAAVVPVIEVPGSSDDMVLVLLPGEKEPVACAQLSPLHSESEEPHPSEKHAGQEHSG